MMKKQKATVVCKNGYHSISTIIECTVETLDSEIIKEAKIKLNPKRAEYDLSRLFVSKREEVN